MNPRAAFTTYTLSRGASSANLSTSPNIYDMGLNGGEAEIRTLGAFASLVFKTSSLNHSDTSPQFRSRTLNATNTVYHLFLVLSSIFYKKVKSDHTEN